MAHKDHPPLVPSHAMTAVRDLADRDLESLSD
jgi:hypothetical protein